MSEAKQVTASLKKPKPLTDAELCPTFYEVDEMDAYIAHLNLRLAKLEAARDEARPLIEWAASSEFREFKKWLEKYGGES